MAPISPPTLPPTLPREAVVRRWLAVTLIVGGALLLWIAPQTWHGALLLTMGVLLELLGMAFGMRRRTRRRTFGDRSWPGDCA